MTSNFYFGNCKAITSTLSVGVIIFHCTRGVGPVAIDRRDRAADSFDGAYIESRSGAIGADHKLGCLCVGKHDNRLDDILVQRGVDVRFDDYAGRRGHSARIWRLLMLVLWHRNFLEAQAFRGTPGVTSTVGEVV